MSEQQGEKQFEPTEHRREQFRKEGKHPRSRDAAAGAGLLAVVATLMGSRAEMSHAVHELFLATHGDLHAMTEGRFDFAVSLGSKAFMALAAPALGAAVLGAAVVGLAQSGFRINTDLVSFKPERLNPLDRLKQMFAPKHAAVETLLSVLRVCLVGYAAYRVIRVELPEIAALARSSVDASIARMTEAVLHLLLVAGGVVSGIAVIDYTQSRFRLSQEMRMTRQEMMDEMRQNDGDPKVKARLKARARAMAKKRALQAVKNADVIVTNPTHIAVALRYEERDAAPVLIAKGHDEAALRIRAEARKHGIPILENRPLARALDAEVPVGGTIPFAHFTAVARVLAYVYKLRGARRRGTRRA